MVLGGSWRRSLLLGDGCVRLVFGAALACQSGRCGSFMGELSMWYAHVTAAGLGLHVSTALLPHEDWGVKVSGKSCNWLFNLCQWR